MHATPTSFPALHPHMFGPHVHADHLATTLHAWAIARIESIEPDHGVGIALACATHDWWAAWNVKGTN